jgi:hypothetical protein
MAFPPRLVSSHATYNEYQSWDGVTGWGPVYRVAKPKEACAPSADPVAVARRKAAELRAQLAALEAAIAEHHADPVARLEEVEVMDPVARLEEPAEPADPVARLEPVAPADPVARLEAAVVVPPTLEELRQQFLAAHPEAARLWKMPAGASSWGDQLFTDYLNFVWEAVYSLEKEEGVPKGTFKLLQQIESQDFSYHLRLTGTEYSYSQHRARPAFTEAACAARAAARAEQERRKAAAEAARARAALPPELRFAAFRARKVSAMAEKERLTSQEAEAVIEHLQPEVLRRQMPRVFQKDTRLALQVINRYATEAGIRVEDAMTILREYAA